MAPTQLIWRGGGLTCVIAGVLLATGQITNLLGDDTQFGTVVGGNLIHIAHLLLIFALISLYSAQARRSGVLGLLGTAMGIIGTSLIVTIVFVNTAGAYSVRVPPSGNGSPVRSTVPEATAWILDSVYSVLGPPIFTIGLIVFGLATVRAGRFPPGVGALLVLGAALAFLGCPLSYVYACAVTFGRGVYIVFVLGTVLIGVGFAWLGFLLLFERRRRAA
jgi:hypothetical protein